MPADALFINARLVLPDRVVEPGSLRVRAGRIVEIAPGELPARGEPIIDAGGRYLAPGFIDIHCHGDGARSFLDEPDAVAANLLRNGTTGVLPTFAYSQIQPGRWHAQIGEFWGSLSARSRQSVWGLHLEGPYTHWDYGANRANAAFIYPPDPAEYGPILADYGEIVRYWTFAPEHEGAVAFAEAAHARGIILAAGHTGAGVEQLAAVLGRGLRCATHWSNASGAPPTRHGGTREPGVDEFTLRHDEMLAEVIADREGHHVRPFLCELLYKVKGPDRILLITDATFAYVEGGGPDDVNLSPTGELSGSRLTMPGAARNFRAFTGCGMVELFRMAALNPARLFGWEAGALEVGKRADLLLVDDEIALHGVWLEGEQVEG